MHETWNFSLLDDFDDVDVLGLSTFVLGAVRADEDVLKTERSKTQSQANLGTALRELDYANKHYPAKMLYVSRKSNQISCSFTW